MTITNRDELKKANQEARLKYQTTIIHNQREFHIYHYKHTNIEKYYIYILTELIKAFASDRVTFICPWITLGGFRQRLSEAGSPQKYAEIILNQIKSSSAQEITFPLDEHYLSLILKLKNGDLIGYVQCNEDDPFYVRASETLNEEMVELGILDPNVEIYFV